MTLLHEIDSKSIMSIVCQQQLWLYRHAAQYMEVDPTYRVVLERDNPTWRRPRGSPQNLWLWQVNGSCWELLGTGRESARRLARRDRQEWRHRVGEATSPLPLSRMFSVID